MSLFARAFGSEKRATLANPPEWFLTALGAGSTNAGESVSVASSLGLVPFWRGVNILANAFATSPLKVYDGRGQSPKIADKTRAWDLLHGGQDTGPNPTMGADEFWALVESHIETWGNSFAWKERGRDGRVAHLWPLDPSRVAVSRINGRLTYVVDGKVDDFGTEADFLHIRGLSKDGVLGYSPVQMAKEALGSQLAQTKFRGKFWANDATPGVALLHPNALKPDAISRIKALWKDAHKGPAKAREVAVLGEGMTIEQMTMPLADAQFIEQERLGRTDIALLLGLPPHMLAGESGGDSLTYSTTEGLTLDLLKFTIGPRFTRVQNAVTRDQDLMPTGHFAKFEAGGLLRATTTERYKAYAVAPHLTINEMRATEDLPPLPDGDVLSPSTDIGEDEATE